MLKKTFFGLKIDFVIGVVLTLISVCFILSPTVHFKIGNVFFGKVPTLYNVKLAEFFFTYATHPLIGKVPPFAYHQLSRTHFIQGNLQASLEEAYKEIELYPEHDRTYYIIGLTLGYMNREHEAIEAFGKFIEYMPESWAARNDRAWLQFRIGDIEGALETIKPATHLMENPWVQNTYGTLLMNKGSNKEAMEAFLQAKYIADLMTEESWGIAYPGNDPRIYHLGLEAMQTSINNNLDLLNSMP